MERTNLWTLKNFLLAAFVLSITASYVFLISSWDSRNVLFSHLPSPLPPAHSVPGGFCSGLRDSRNGSNHLEVTWQLLTRLYETDKLDFSQVEKYRVYEEADLSDLDQEILRDEPLQNLSTVATHVTSTITVVGVQNKTLRQGDAIIVRVDMKDSLGRPVRKGGHQVRIWIADKSRELSAAGEVDDLRNGSYVTSIPLLWTGRATVFAALMRPREYQRLILDELNRRKTTRPLFGCFIKGEVSETTVCMPYPVIPCYLHVCNFTLDNGALPWYCGKPVSSALSCGDWRNTRFPRGDVQPRPTTPAEELLEQSIEKFSESQRGIIRLQQTVDVETEKGFILANSVSCHKKPLRETWTDQSPHGYWENKQWRHLKCTFPSLTQEFIHRCVRNKTFVMLGDSNARAIEEKISQLSGCRMQGKNPGRSRVVLKMPNFCNDSTLNFTLEWHPHAYPFNTFLDRSLRRGKISPADYMANIPPTGDFVIFIHLYAHFHWSESSTYGMQVRDTARAVRNLLERKPSVKVVVRGPHPWNTWQGDFHGARSLHILKNAFRGLEDRVVFLNFWDMNIANENVDIHPQDYVVNAMTNIFLGFVCS